MRYSRNTESTRHRPNIRKLCACVAIAVCAWSIFTGCGPTYPKERIQESIVDLCKREYGIDVKTTIAGRTIGIYVPLHDLIDFTFAISKSASEKINDVILSVTRVAISTDANYDFYCIIAHDVRIPEIQIVVIKSVDDVKRFLLSDISRGEYSKRMIVDMRLSPQAQKEKTIKNIFEKMRLDPKWQEEVLNDFFRAAPSELGDIGYWGGKFYMKDIQLSEFLAEQVASRMKMEFREDQGLARTVVLKASKGKYMDQGPARSFKFDVMTIPKPAEGETHRAVLQKVIAIVSGVLHSYRFNDYEYVTIVDEREGSTFRVSRDDLESYRMKKLTFEDIVKKGSAL